MSGTATPPSKPQRRVGLDKPCSLCGEAIYFNYKGPVEGICGRCADRVRKKPKRRKARRPAAPGTSRLRRYRGSLLLLLFAVAAAAFIAHAILAG